MRTVEASNRITRTSSLVEMWLSGLKHLAANEASFGSARSNRAISVYNEVWRKSKRTEGENSGNASLVSRPRQRCSTAQYVLMDTQIATLMIVALRNLTDRHHLQKYTSRTSSSAERRIWDANVQGSIPWSWTICGDSEAGAHTRLKSARRWFDPNSPRLRPLTLAVEDPTDNREAVGRHHEWVDFREWQSGRLRAAVDRVPKKHACSNQASRTILRDVEIGIKAESDSAILGSSPSLSVCGISKDSNASGCKLDTRQCKSVISLN